MVCSKCKEGFTKPTEVAKCEECKAEFHPGCCRIRTAAKLKALVEKGGSWLCEDCNRDASSVGSRSDSEDITMVGMLKLMQKQMAEDSSQFKKSFAALELAMSKVQESLTAVAARLAVVEEENSKLQVHCEELRKENTELNRKVSDLERSVVVQEQYSRLSNLEIRGVPLTGGEDIYAVLESIAKSINVPFDRRDVSTAHRLPQSRDQRFPPAIVVQFARRSSRAEWLAAAKVKRLQAKDLHPSFPSAPVFVNEHLTRHNKDLLRRCRAGVRAGALAYAWCKDGKVFVRKTQDSRAVRIILSLKEL